MFARKVLSSWTVRSGSMMVMVSSQESLLRTERSRGLSEASTTW